MDTSSIFDKVPPFLRENVLIIALICIGLIFLSYGLIGFLGQTSSNEDILISDTEEFEESPSVITVDVSGAVNKPGVYSLPSDSRVTDAIREAGGLSIEANQDAIAQGINLAKSISDGEKIYIPSTLETSESEVLASETSKISINTASSTELDSLPGIGPVTTEKIISGRPYSSVDDLLSKKVVGQAVFEKIKDLISL